MRLDRKVISLLGHFCLIHWSSINLSCCLIWIICEIPGCIHYSSLLVLCTQKALQMGNRWAAKIRTADSKLECLHLYRRGAKVTFHCVISRMCMDIMWPFFPVDIYGCFNYLNQLMHQKYISYPVSVIITFSTLQYSSAFATQREQKHMQYMVASYLSSIGNLTMVLAFHKTNNYGSLFNSMCITASQGYEMSLHWPQGVALPSLPLRLVCLFFVFL